MSLHLVPADADGVHEHDLHIACPCQPLVETAERADGTYGQVVAHRGAGPEQDQSEE